LEKFRVKQTVKLSLLWDAEKRVFHAVECISGEAHEINTLKGLVDSVRMTIWKLFGDPGFSSRDNVQDLTDLGITPRDKAAGKLHHSEQGESGLEGTHKGVPRARIREVEEKDWIRREVPRETKIGALINRFGDEVRTRSVRMASKLLGARVTLHNFFAVLFNGCFIGPA